MSDSVNYHTPRRGSCGFVEIEFRTIPATELKVVGDALFSGRWQVFVSALGVAVRDSDRTRLVVRSRRFLFPSVSDVSVTRAKVPTRVS